MRGVDGSGAPMPDYLDDLKMLSRRLLMVALRAWLGFWDAWDTGCIWHNDLTLASRRKVLDEYVTLSEEDEKWYMRRWDDENLESDKAVCQRALTQAREGMRRRILSAPVTNTMSFHPPKPAAEG
jgi:hypothetical protein